MNQVCGSYSNSELNIIYKLILLFRFNTNSPVTKQLIMETSGPKLQEIPTLIESILPRYRDKLLHISQYLYENPELAYNEFSAHKVLTEFLSQNNFTVTPSYHLKTAFKATFHIHETKTEKAPIPCIICEYDALPSLGHACGHNLIAIAGLAAGVIIKDVMQSQRDKFRNCSFTIIGTPAEEEGGGKIDLLKLDGFKGVDFAMMVHPYPCNVLYPPIMMMGCYLVKYSSNSDQVEKNGICLDAAVLAYNSIGMLRQQFKPGMRIHGVITKGCYYINHIICISGYI